MITTSIAEIVSIASLVPFLTAITNPQKLYNLELMRPLIVFFSIHSYEDLLFPVTMLFISTALFAGACRIYLVYFMSKITYSITAEISSMIYKIYLMKDYLYHISTSKDVMLDMIVNKSNNSMRNIILSSLTLGSSIAIFSIIVFALFIYNWLVTSVAILFFGGIYFFADFITRTKTRSNNNIISEFSYKNIREIKESLGSIKNAILAGVTNYFVENFISLNSKIKSAQASNVFISNSPRYFIEALGMVVIAVIAYNLSDSGDATYIFTILGIFVLSTQKLLPIMQKIYNSNKVIKQNTVQAEQIISLIEEAEALQKNNLSKTIAFKDFKDAIIFKDVKFSFGSKVIFNHLNFTLKKGSRVAVVGESGVGKTTLLDLLMGLLSPETGKIIIDNKALSTDNIASWRSLLSHVPQDCFLSNKTIQENVAFAIPKNLINMKRVIRACKQAQVHDFINSLPEKYNTIIGSGGRVLSGGQAQRFGIARALYQKSSVIILDEATNSLDKITEESVLLSLNKLPSTITVIMITHSKTPLKSCDTLMKVTKRGVKIEKI
ncbi:ABC transporter ATP-binding protein/permease [Methylophilaceae bacterium]|nr:ABC transporter ATP-binding protein/permease [Methylophilaceae bacterium]